MEDMKKWLIGVCSVMGIFFLLAYSPSEASCEGLAESLSSCDSDCGSCESSYPCDSALGLSSEQKKIRCNNDCLETNDKAFCDCKCNGGITLNTNVPFIGRCIALGSEDSTGPNSTTVTQTSAFPRLMKALTNILLSIILVASLIMIIAGGVMIASSGANSGGYDQGKKLIRKVIIGLILLGASGMILALINPNFFG